MDVTGDEYGERLENSAADDALYSTILQLFDRSQRRLWVKVPWWDHTDSRGRALFDAAAAAAARGVDVRVVLRNDASGLPTIAALRRANIPVRPLRYLHEKELVADDSYLEHSMNFTGAELARNTQVGHLHSESGQAAATLFAAQWDQLTASDQQRGEACTTRMTTVVPDDIARLLEHQDLNPFQADVVPAVLAATGHTVVVAPTGAGKTVVGEVAVLRAVVHERRRAVWLVPARALAGELGKGKARWASHGIRVETLTGESNLSSARLEKAQVWVATTEKFEALFRRTSLTAAVADIGCIVVDEIHLVGDETRGATLEALLARLRLLSDTTRVVGLSATVTNADELAAWLGAELLRSEWRPTVLVSQLVGYEGSGSYHEVEVAKDLALLPIVEEIISEPPGVDPSTAGSVLIFVGAKGAARAVAAKIAGLPSTGDEEEVAAACLGKGVGFHYRGAPQADEVLRRFRARDLRVLVATSGLSTGINVPARAVIVRDLSLGMSPIDVSQVQQMFGRAGRAGMEAEGFAYLLVPHNDRENWQQKLADGYTARSQLDRRLADAALAEIHLGSVGSVADLSRWYSTTFAASRGSSSTSSLETLLAQLVDAGLVQRPDEHAIRITELGTLTCQLMVEVGSAVGIIQELSRTPTPNSARAAEMAVLSGVTRGASPFQERQVNPRTWQPIIERLLADLAIPAPGGPFGSQLSLAAAGLALTAPTRLRSGTRIENNSTLPLREVVEDLPRYLTWVAELGRLGMLDWQAPVAYDLAERLTNYELTPQPQRGIGRTIHFVRSLVEPDDASAFLQQWWHSARKFDAPEMIERVPDDDRIDPDRLARARQNRLRSTGVALTLDNDALVVESKVEGALARQVLSLASGRNPVRVVSETAAPMPVPTPAGARETGRVAVDCLTFGRGDFMYSGLIDEVALPTASAPTVDDRLADARTALLAARDLAAVTDEPGLWQRLTSSKQNRLREQVAERLRLFQPLTPAAKVLAEGLDPVSAVLELTSAVEALCPGAAPWDSLRSPLAVLTSGQANPTERTVALAALVAAAGIDVGIVRSRSTDKLFCVANLPGGWAVTEAALPSGPFTRVAGDCPDEFTTMPAPQPLPPPTVALTWPWLVEFTSATSSI